jgi:hypothetical protein
MSDQQARPRKWWSFGGFRAQPLIETKLATDVPINIAIEKLRGFVTDQQARIISTREDRVEMEISSEKMGLHRRQGDRPTAFRIELTFSEQRVERSNAFGLAKGAHSITIAQVTIRPRRARNRRSVEQADRSRLILQSLKAYLMAKEIDAGESNSPEAAAAK